MFLNVAFEQYVQVKKTEFDSYSEPNMDSYGISKKKF